MFGLFQKPPGWQPKAKAQPQRTNIDLESERAYGCLRDLPQFAPVKDMKCGLGSISGCGLLNLLNGCLVSRTSEGLRLTWQIDGYETTAHSTLLSEEQQIARFVSLMQKQASRFS